MARTVFHLLTLRQDEIDWFNRLADGHPVLWMANRSTCTWHATADGRSAVCSEAVRIDREFNPYPGEDDRSRSALTCERCQGLVRRIPMPAPGAERAGR